MNQLIDKSYLPYVQSTEGNPYRIVIADDHQIVVDGLTTILTSEHDLDIVASASNMREAVSRVQEHSPDCLITDLNMPGKNGVEMISELRVMFPRLIIIVLTMYFEESMVNELKKIGVHGFLLKHSDKETLISSVKDILHGTRFIDPGVESLNNSRQFGYDDEDKFEDAFDKLRLLGKREMEVLVHVAKGLSNQEIADSMFVSIETIYSHRKHIKKKLGLKNTAEFTAFAVKHDLLGS